MNDITQILNRAVQAGISLSLDEQGGLVVDSAQPLTDEQRVFLRAHKPAIIAVLDSWNWEHGQVSRQAGWLFGLHFTSGPRVEYWESPTGRAITYADAREQIQQSFARRGVSCVFLVQIGHKPNH